MPSTNQSTKHAIRRVEKPWGYELIWAETKDYVGKILHIKKGHQLSLQYHKVKEETMYLSSGKDDPRFRRSLGQNAGCRNESG